MDLRVLFSSPIQKLNSALVQSEIAVAAQRNPDNLPQQNLHGLVSRVQRFHPGMFLK